MAKQTTRAKDSRRSSPSEINGSERRKEISRDTNRGLFQDLNALSQSTRDKLEYGRFEYWRTKHYDAALRCLDNHGSVTLIGPPGAGKTALACELLRHALHKGSTVLAAETPRDVMEIFRKSREEVGKTLVLVDAILGESDVDVTRVEEWQEVLVEVDMRLRLRSDVGKGHVFQFVFTVPSVDRDDDVEADRLLKAHSLVVQADRTVDLSVWDEEDKRTVFQRQGDLWEEDTDDPKNSFDRVASLDCRLGFPLTCRSFFMMRERIPSIEEFFSDVNSQRALLESFVKTDPESALVMAMVVLADNRLDEEMFPSYEYKRKPGNNAADRPPRGRGGPSKREESSHAAAPSLPASSSASNGSAASLLSRVQRRVGSGVSRLRSWLDKRLHSADASLPVLHADSASLVDKAQLLLSLEVELTLAVEGKVRAMVVMQSVLSQDGGRISFRHSLHHDAMVDILQARDRETLACLCSRGFLHDRVLMTEDPQVRRGRVYLDPTSQGLLVDRLVDYISRRFYHVTCSHPNLDDPAIADAVFSGLREKKVLKDVLTSPDVEGHGSFLACCVSAYPSALFATAFEFCRKSKKLSKVCLHPRALAKILNRCGVYDNVEAFDVTDKFLGTSSFRDMKTENPGLVGISDAVRQLMRLGLPGSCTGGSPCEDKPKDARDSGDGAAADDDNEWDLFCGKPCCQTLASLAVLHRSNKVLERMVSNFLNTLTQGQTRDALYLACVTNNARAFAVLMGRPMGLGTYPLVQLIARAGADDVIEHLLSALEEVAEPASEGHRDLTDVRDGRGRTPLMVAAHHGHVRLVELLLPHSDVNARDDCGFTALMLASFRGFPHVVDALLPASDVTFKDNFGRTALHTAAARGHVHVVTSLLPACDPDHASSDGDSALAIAACYGRHEVVSTLLPVSDCSRQNAIGRTALHLAAMHGHASAVSLLLPHSDAGCVTERGLTALQMAATNGHSHVVQILLPASHANHVATDGMNALELAAIQGHDKVVEVLLPRTDLSHSDGDGNTALHLASYFGHADTVRVLLPACDASLQDKEGRTPLHVAATHGYDEIAQLLLPVSDPRRRDREGETALAMAVSFGYRAVVETLLQASDVTLANASGQTPLHLAATGGHLEIARLLLPACDPSRVDAEGNTALNLAYRGGNLDLVQLLLPVTDPSLVGDHSLTALHIAAECGSVETVQTLARGSDPLKGDEVGRTPLHMATWAGRVEAIEALLSVSDPSQTDVEGRTALHLASFCGHVHCVRLLLPVSDPRLSDKEGNTPLHLAALRGHAGVVALLLPCNAPPAVRGDANPAPPGDLAPASRDSSAETERGTAYDAEKQPSSCVASRVGENDADSPDPSLPKDDFLTAKTGVDLISDPLHRNKEGLTALELAARAGHADIIAMLLPFCKGEAALSAWQLVLRHHPGSCALGVFHGFVPQKGRPPSPPLSP